MSLPHALLGLINYHPATGYELKVAFNKSIHFFWNATLPQIYRTLNEMESKGWLAATFKHQEGRPSRKVYRLTSAGLKELKKWLTGPTEIPEARHPMLVKTFFGNQMDKDSFAALLKEWRDYHVNLLSMYETQVVPVIDQYARLTGASEDARYWSFALDYGRRFAKTNIEWCDATLEALACSKPRDKRRRSAGPTSTKKQS